ncbi:hypothetical protein CKO43_04455, partial [Rubrivivax gelatinosus]|nr:hypothetical protein [Rubrivivax gelatinosus]
MEPAGARPPPPRLPGRAPGLARPDRRRPSAGRLHAATGSVSASARSRCWVSTPCSASSGSRSSR